MRVRAPALLLLGIDRRLTLLFEPIPTVKAMKQVQQDKTELISNAHDKQKLGQVANLADADELTDALQREAEINAGHATITGAAWVHGPTQIGGHATVCGTASSPDRSESVGIPSSATRPT